MSTTREATIRSTQRDATIRSAQRIGWHLLQLAGLIALALLLYRLTGLADMPHRIDVPYRIDIDVYRMGGRAWLDGQPLYRDALFSTQAGLNLPFTYPPLAAITFSPFAVLSLPAASTAITLTTVLLLAASVYLVLGRLDVWPTSSVIPGTAMRRLWLTLIIVAFASHYLEPLHANYDFGQINVVLMALVIIDCAPQRTPWPRGLLIGLAIALKLTPAVFLLYFLVSRDWRPILTSIVSFLGATTLGFLLAWKDSVEYWTSTVGNTGRIGGAALNTNQNIAGILARTDLSEGFRKLGWVLLSVVVLTITVWALRHALRGGEQLLALMCTALFGMVVSPVSWSHHWVWVLPTLITTTVVGRRRRNKTLSVLTAIGLALTIWAPSVLLPQHHESAASWWRQLIGASYVWWALAVIVAVGLTIRRPSKRPNLPLTPVSDRAAEECP
jgi:alpha-1,2-mannosyltransferase